MCWRGLPLWKSCSFDRWHAGSGQTRSLLRRAS
ncbi:hypothetical protein ACJ73_04638 [Blastomyces percursus]|uniref:Uncharacterized protein n=1 Tax=Blastomyces percursus TaxID=1658174 RepID=A0A1J9Q5L0_9EURO|nr:hypothetical protein ACJ73_04638 [Blastomyces percursus]